jgi:excisionase family DNA binding protein
LHVSTPDEETANRLLTPEQVRAHLGVSRSFVYRTLAAGTIPSVRVGRLRKIRPADLERYIESRLEGGDE